MPQFEVYAIPNEAQRPAMPYLVVLQSDQLELYASRLRMPLARLARRPRQLPRRLSHTVDVLGERLFLAPHLCAALPSKLLTRPVASMRAEAQTLLDALDAVISGV